MGNQIGDVDPGTTVDGTVTPPAPEPSQTTEPTTSNNPGSQTDWESKYKGLQATYNKLYSNHSDITAKYNQAVEEKENALQEVNRLKTELASASENLANKDKSIQDTQSSVETKAREYERLKLVATKYPNLINLELNGLIPDAKEEELEQKLQVLNETIMKQVDAKAANTLSNTPPGSTQHSNNIPPLNDVNDVFARLNQLAGSKSAQDQAEYNNLFKIYQDLMNKQK